MKDEALDVFFKEELTELILLNKKRITRVQIDTNQEQKLKTTKPTKYKETRRRTNKNNKKKELEWKAIRGKGLHDPLREISPNQEEGDDVKISCVGSKFSCRIQPKREEKVKCWFEESQPKREEKVKC